MKEPLWKRDPKIQITENGRYFKLGHARNGNVLILFHNYNWYPPNKEEIFDTKDSELIELYYKIDCENQYMPIRKNNSIHDTPIPKERKIIVPSKTLVQTRLMELP